MREMKFISIRGANVNNLKNLSVEIPRDQMVVLTGLSGSGKSSLAFDTIYAEGQRRYMESLSSYARQFLGQMEKPDVESIEGLPPAISIDQKSTNRNPRSTVGTVTEIFEQLNEYRPENDRRKKAEISSTSQALPLLLTAPGRHTTGPAKGPSMSGAELLLLNG